MAGNLNILSVNAGKRYNIYIGNKIFPELKEKNLFKGEKYALVVSSAVYRLHKNYILDFFNRLPHYDVFIMNDSEDNKNYNYALEFFSGLLQKGYSRNSCVIGIGGGVTGDFAGFIAALYMRGIGFVLVPTTLLSMVDSSIGGKVAVNIDAGKNILGAFYQPDTVITDISFLSTLPEKELKNGISELLKHALTGADRLLGILMENDLKTVMQPDIIAQLVLLSSEFKAGIVSQDERESGLRAVLNFGHTAGHAIESFYNYKGVSHGEAVAIGIKIESEISRRSGMLLDRDYELIITLLNKYDLITNDVEIDADCIIEHMQYDKKNKNGSIRFVLLNGIGNPVYDQKVDTGILRKALSE